MSSEYITPAEAIKILTAKGIKATKVKGEIVADFGHSLINLSTAIQTNNMVLKAEVDFLAKVRVVGH